MSHDGIKSKDGHIQGITFVRKDNGTDFSYKHQKVWKSIIALLISHVLAAYGFFLLVTGSLKFVTFVWTVSLWLIGVETITVGAHRYYSHKTFKATPLLQAVFLLTFVTVGQYSTFTWVRNHRLHHRYSDTDGDPHNARRGFFFSHLGWLLHKKHPLVRELGRDIDMTDLKADWMVMFQKKYYLPLYFLLGILLPVAVPVYCFGESWTASIFVCYFCRYIVLLNSAALINSAAHLDYGTRPYDAQINPRESWFLSLITNGEGWHNFHHTFPWDYRAAEFNMHFNLSAKLIRFFELIGLAWDLKTVSLDMVEKRTMRTGDGTHYLFGNEEDKKNVTAIGFLHPLNPTYTTLKKVPDLN